jgi:ABC-type phosphate transport system substrate-binding protein
MEPTMRINKLNRLVLAGLLSTLAASAWAGDFVVIVAAGNPVTALRQEQVAAIFLGQTGYFPDGREAVALDQSLGSSIRDEFYSKVAAKSPALVRAHWSKIIFTGRGQPPREVPNSIAMRKLVAENRGLIGYIERSALDASVKAVLSVP